MPYNILIVDDDMELQKMLKNYFRLKDYEVDAASDGALLMLCIWSVEEVHQNIWRKYAAPASPSENISKVHGESQTYGFAKKIERISEDEMGRLCTEFETMREKFVQNSRKTEAGGPAGLVFFLFGRYMSQKEEEDMLLYDGGGSKETVVDLAIQGEDHILYIRKIKLILDNPTFLWE